MLTFFINIEHFIIHNYIIKINISSLFHQLHQNQDLEDYITFYRNS